MSSSESKIWVFAEHRQGRLAEVSLELFQKALDLSRHTNCGRWRLCWSATVFPAWPRRF
ncbi:MAG: hypothetical protein JRG97_08910 [Deltaproteobacteria bacterium]|nr:hypothetical protein [Deltaproteobacteria bacterium]